MELMYQLGFWQTLGWTFEPVIEAFPQIKGHVEEPRLCTGKVQQQTIVWGAPS